ncbi:putative oxidoreductase C19A8.06 [Phytophthora cinnamomi]|uniref:putative oxidoreductase C19A8.06 n=1 Tax=Phytophthora cinnamomi TaxID=4785 RepID=UPI0035599EFE|nr:putative oxidoreductase C19A8.06 [Phytophthora cinnamomi]
MVAPSKHALVIGASSGIGLGVAKELAPIVAKLTLCSRSYPEELLKTIKTENPNVEVVHEKLDVSLMHEVRKFTTKHAETQFDWIVMSPGIMTLNGRTETAEGLDVKMATHYYGRFMLVHDLLEGLNRPGVRVLNILGAGHGGEVDVSDLDLKRTYSGKRCADVTTQYSDLMAQAFSEHAPKASFMHASPGFVNTGLPKQLPGYLRMPYAALSTLFARSPETCGKYMVSALLNDDYASGWKLLDQDAKEVASTKFHTEELKIAVWEHTTQTIHDVMKQ